MDSSFSPKDEFWFLRVCHHISNAVDHISSFLGKALSVAHNLHSVVPVGMVAVGVTPGG